MLAHCTSHAAAGCFDGGHIAAICDVRAATLLICLQKVGTYNLAVFFRDEDLRSHENQ